MMPRLTAPVIARGAPIVVVAAFVVLLIVHFGSVLAGIYSDSDGVSLPVIGQLYPDAPNGASVVLGFGGGYTGLWFELATRSLPFHRQLWEVGPWLVALAAIGLLAWATARVAGRFAGLLVAFVLACASPTLLTLQFEWAHHSASVAHACLLSAFLVALAERRGMLGRLHWHLLACAVVASVTAAGISSDPFLVLSGFVPFILAGLLVAQMTSAGTANRIRFTTLGMAVLMLGEAAVVKAAMSSRHIQPVHFQVRFARWDALGSNAVTFGQSLASLFNGDFGDAKIDGRSLLSLTCAVVLTAAAVLIARSVRDWAREAKRDITAPRRAEFDLSARSALLAFWSLSIVLTSAGFLLSRLPTDHLARYLLPVAYGGVVIVAVTAAERGAWFRHAVLAGACVIGLASVVSLAARDVRPTAGDEKFAALLQSFAGGEHLRYGYAHYWDAARLTWQSHGRIQVYPIERCNAPHGLCIFPFHYISSWYTPRPNTRTFLILDARYGIDDPGKRLGGVEERIDSGHYSVLVYKYDIAANLGPPPPWLGT